MVIPSDHEHVNRRFYVRDQLVLQLHAWDEENHPNLVDANRAPVGHGVLAPRREAQKTPSIRLKPSDRATQAL
jgi:hypothetical protein